MAGVWRRERTGSRLRVVIEPFDAVTPAARARAEDEAARLELWALPCSVSPCSGR